MNEHEKEANKLVAYLSVERAREYLTLAEERKSKLLNQDGELGMAIERQNFNSVYRILRHRIHNIEELERKAADEFVSFMQAFEAAKVNPEDIIPDVVKRTTTSEEAGE